MYNPEEEYLEVDSTLEFNNWLQEVDNIVINIAGVGVEDLADCDSFNMFADCMSPTEAATQILEENDFPHEALQEALENWGLI